METKQTVHPMEPTLGFGFIVALALQLSFSPRAIEQICDCIVAAGMMVALWFKHGKISPRALAILCSILTGRALAMGWNTARIERLHVGAEGADWSYTLLDRVAIASHCLVHYVWQLALPLEQVFFYRRFSPSFADATNQACLAFCAVVLVAFIMLAMRGVRGPLAACLYFGGSAFPALGFLNVYPHRFSFVADHFVYFPIAGLLCLWFAGLASMLGKLESSKWKWLTHFVPASLCIWYAIATWIYLRAYSNEIALWRDTWQRTRTVRPRCKIWVCD